MKKNCLVCGKEFFKKYTCSRKDWSNSKFCSNACNGKSKIGQPSKKKGIPTGLVTSGCFKKGHVPWSKGKPGQKKEKHGMWKGGKIRRKGYIFLHRPEHSGADSLGYVREHRLIMEEHLGRILDPKEVVHHINEIKDDNRLENLMLFEDNGKHTAFHLKYLR